MRHLSSNIFLFCYLMMLALLRFPQCVFAALCILDDCVFFTTQQSCFTVRNLHKWAVILTSVWHHDVNVMIKKENSPFVVCLQVFPGGVWTWHGVISRAEQLFGPVNAEIDRWREEKKEAVKCWLQSSQMVGRPVLSFLKFIYILEVSLLLWFRTVYSESNSWM